MQDMQDGEGLDFEIELKTEGISGGTAKRTWQHPQPPSRIKQWLQQLLPPTCHDCRVLIPANAYAEAGTPFLCPECLRRLPWLVPAFSCQRCGNLTAEPMRQGCPQCFDSNWSLHQTIADLRYEGIVREWVLRCKFGRQDWLGPLLGRLMVLAQQQRPPLPPNVVLIPVPIAPQPHSQARFQSGTAACSSLAQQSSGSETGGASGVVTPYPRHAAANGIALGGAPA